MRSNHLWFLRTLLLGVASQALASSPQQASPSVVRIPQRFEANEGQAPADVRYIVRGSNYSLLLTDRGASVVQRTKSGDTASISLDLVGARPGALVSGVRATKGVSNYFQGSDPARWRRNVPQYEGVQYTDIYPGIDLVHYGVDGELEYDFVVKPGADPGVIGWRMSGAKISLDREGNLLARTRHGVVMQRAPRLYQGSGSAKTPVTGAFVIEGDRVSFAVGAYDRSRALVIDPVLSYASYLGGAGGDNAQAIALDAAGNIYVAGTTASVAFPTLAPYQAALRGSQDAFVAKLDPTGSTLLFSTFFGGGASETATSIGVGPSGEIWFGGTTSSTDLPTVNPLLPTLSPFGDAFVAKLDASGSSLAYSTYLGGSGGDQVTSIAVGSSGQAYVGGYTFSSNFPMLNAWQPTRTGSSVGFISRFNSNGALAFSTFIGGGGDQSVNGVATDSSGNVYLAGYTTASNFPVLNPRQAVKSSGYDAFIVKLTATGAPVYSTFLGGNGEDRAKAIAVDASGAAYVAGYTDSTNFPTVAPLQAQRAGTVDAFVVKLRGNNTGYDYATYLGGTAYEEGRGIKVDAQGRAYVAGVTNSTNFPTLSPSQAANGGSSDTFVAKISVTGSTLLYGTYFGGSALEDVQGMALDAAGAVYVAGQSTSTNLPVVGPIQATQQGNGDAFVAKFTDPNDAPIANAGPDQSIELPLSATLTGVASTDPNGDAMTYEWRDDTDTVIATTSSTTVSGVAGSRVYSLKVSDPQSANSTDTVTLTFLPEQAPVVAIVSPAAGASVYTGVPQTIAWLATDNGVLVRLDVFFSLDGGSSYVPVSGCSNLPGTSSSCTGTLPGPGTVDVRLKVRATDAAGHIGETERLVNTVDGVIVTSQNSASSWPLGSTQTVTWSHTVAPGSTFKIELSVNGGVTWSVLAAAAPDTGTFDWVVTPPHSANARVRVSPVDTPAITDTNNAAITIGTPAYRVKDIHPTGASAPSQFFDWNGVVYFSAQDAANGREFWKSDGTIAGTVLVKDVTPGAVGSTIDSITLAGGRLYFRAGTQLWRSDGTIAGTVRLDSGFNTLNPLVALGNSVYYGACHSSYGCGLWKASTAGVAIVNQTLFAEELTAVNGTLFFSATSGTLGKELWKSDGTLAGTVLVKDINNAAANLSSSPLNLTAVGNTLFFTAIDYYLGRELFKSDGTTAGTVMVANLAESYTSFYVQETRAFGSRLFYRGYYYNGGPTWDDPELYVSDGTTPGTFRVKDICAGETCHSTPTGLTAMGDYVYFVAYDTINGSTLYRSDGTSAGTIALRSFIPAIGTPVISTSLRVVDGALYFTASSSFGSELWRTDGTAAGTYLVQDIAPGAASSSPSMVTPSGHRVLFSAADGSGTDQELWAMDLPMNQLPTVSAGVDQTVNAGVSVNLVATGADVDADALTYEWRDGSNNVVATTASATLTLPAGVNTLTVTVSDGHGGTASDDVTVTVRPSLTIETTGRGTVQADSSPACGDAAGGGSQSCTTFYAPGATAHLVATPGDGAVFDGWTGACASNGTSPTCDVSMSVSASVGATFLGPYTLTINVESLENGVGQAYVTVGQGTTTECLAVAGTTTTCTAQVRPGDTVNFSAWPLSLSVLDSIAGCTADPFDPNGASCYPAFVMTGTKTVTATFRGPQTLTIQAASLENGVGQAYVTVGQGTTTECLAVAGTTTTCTAQVRVGDTVNFSAWPLGLSVLDSIAGCTADPFDPNGASCYPGFVMTGPKTVTATFHGPQTLTIQAASLENGVGQAYVGIGGATTECLAVAGTTTTCTTQVRVGAVVNFSAWPLSLSVLDSIAGCTADPFDPNGASCFPGFVMTGPKTVTASFRGPQTLSVGFSGTGSGDIDLPSTGTCTLGQGTCAFPLRVGGTQQLVATPSADSLFQSWLGACAGQGPSCSIVVSDDAATQAVFTLRNRAPIAVAGGPYSGVRNEAVVFTGAGSSDADNDPLTYSWDFGDGSPTGTGVAPTHAYSTTGTFTVTLTVNDGTATTAPAASTVTIANRAPYANIGGPYYPSFRNEVRTFDGTQSGDLDGDTITYSWNFGDGATGTGASPTHGYTQPGTFTVTLVVNDGTLDSAPRTATIEVQNRAPGILLGAGPLNEWRNLAYTTTASAWDLDNDPVTVSWDFGDGTTATGTTITHAYAAIGTYTMTVKSNDGLLDSAPATLTVIVSNRPPQANPGGPYAGVRTESISFSGAGSSDLEGDPLTYSWNFGDGGTATGIAPSHIYMTAGSFTVTLTVNDGTLNSTPATATVTVASHPPVANPGGPYSGTKLAPISFNGSGSTDPDGDPLTYLWNFGDALTGTGVSPTHTYGAVGTYSVTLRVSDGTLTSAPIATTVQINNVVPTVTITAPASGSVFSIPAGVAITANASDPDGSIVNVQFYVGGNYFAQDASAPYTATWTGLTAGAYALTAIATDSNGATTTSAPVMVTLNQPPTVSLTSPPPNAQYAAPATIPLSANAADADGTIAQVQFFRDSTSLGIDTTSPYSVTWSSATAGSYTLTAVATDNRGAVVASSPVVVKVTATLAPTADAYVRASNANSNFGTDTTLTVQQGSSNSNIRWTYLKFDLTSVPTITNAKVRLFGAVSATTGTTIQTAVYSVSTTSWSETGLTWNNKPASGATALATATIVNNSTTARWYELDVTAYLQAEKAAGRNVVALAVKGVANSTPFVSFTSREGTAANRPQVVVVP